MKIYLDRENPRSAFTQLEAGLKELSFYDNFSGFFWEGIIAAGAEARIRNLIGPSLPRGYVVTRAQGVNNVLDGPTDWTTDYVFLKNGGGVSATLTVFFFR